MGIKTGTGAGRYIQNGGFVKNSFGTGDLIKVVTIAAGGLSGGISSTIAGGSFWAGARQGLITSGLNHVAHSGIKYIQKRSLPTFDNLQSKYRRYDEITDEDLFKEYGGDMQDALDYNDKRGRNTYACALRVSVALVENGELIAKQTGVTLKANDGNYYIVNTEKLNDYLTQNYELSDTSMNQSSYSGRKGIIFFRIGYSDASGHITLWDGNNVLGGTYDAADYFSKASAVYFYETN